MLSILLIEDEDLLRDHIRAGLEGAGYRVRGAGSGNQGLRMFEAERPDLVVTDLVMDGGEGIEAILTIRRSDPGLPIVAMSGNPQYLHNSAQLGATHTLLKPFTIGQLLEILADCRPAISVTG